MLGGIQVIFMYKQLLAEAPWVDVIVRGECEEIFPGLAWRDAGDTPAAALVGRGSTVVHTDCCARGDPVCRFEFAVARRPLARPRLALST